MPFVRHEPLVVSSDPLVMADMRRRMRAYIRDDQDPFMLADFELDALIYDRTGDMVLERPGTVILAAADACEILSERFGPDSPRGMWYGNRADELVRHAAQLRIL